MMKIHLGKEIESIAKERGLSQSKVADLIGEKQQNVGNDYKKESLPMEKILQYSKALNKNFVAYYYDEEPLKTFRDREFADLREKINTLQARLDQAENLLTSKDEIISAQKELIETQRKLIEMKQ